MADGTIISYGDPAPITFSGATNLIADEQSSAVLIESTDDKDYIKINTTSGSEAVQLVSSGTGRVSIGTHDPYTSINADADNLVVGDGTGNEGITIVCGSSAGDYGSIYFGDPSSGTQGQIRYEQNNEVMSFCTNTSERMRIDLNGRVGINDTSPSFTPGWLASDEWLTIKGAAGGALFLERTGSTARKWGVGINTAGAFVVSDDTGSTAPLAIDTAGNVGIGTTVPTQLLHVFDGSCSAATDASTHAVIESDGACFLGIYGGSTQDTGIRFGDSALQGKIAYSNNGDAMKFYTNGSNEQMRITSAGKVGIGNDSPTKNLSIVNPDGEVQLELRSNAEDTNAVFYLGTPHDPGAVNKTAIIAKSDVGYSQSDLHFCLNNTDDNTTEVSLSDSRMSIDTDGNVMITGDAAPVLEIRDDRDNPGATDLGAISFTSSDASAGDDYCATIVCESINGVSNAKPDGALRFTMFENGTANGVVRMENNGDVDNTTGAYGTISDERIKENITDAPSQWDDLKSIQFRKYNLINNDKAMIGCVAQELESVCPGLVSTAEGIRESQGVDIEGLKSVKQSILFMKGMKALQEAILRIEVLESRLNEGN
jgi:hypothetical protein